MASSSNQILYDVPFAEYLGDRWRDAISGSDIAAFVRECPAHAWAFMRANPLRAPSSTSAAMRRGSATHALILEGEDAFNARYVIKPDDMSFATREGKAWRAAQVDREIIHLADAEAAYRMRDAVRSMLEARALLDAPGGRAEVTLVATDPDTGLELLCRPDWILPDGLSANLKTARNIAPEQWRRQVAALRYDLSDALYRRVARLCGLADPEHCFLVIGSERPHLGYIAALSASAASAADQQLSLVLERIARCKRDGNWPGYADGVIEIDLPAYATQSIHQQISEAFQ